MVSVIRGDDNFDSDSSVVLEYISTSTVTSAVATLDITSGFDSSAYFGYRIVYKNITPSASAGLYMLYSTDGGSSYKTTTSDYDNVGIRWINGFSISTTGAGDKVNVLPYATPTAYAGIVGYTELYYGPGGTYNYAQGLSFVTGYSTTNNMGGALENFALTNTSNFNALRFQFNSGNITSGSFILYGMRS